MVELTIVSMNCLGLPVPIPGLRRRLSALGKALISIDADVACLQEVWRWQHVPLLRDNDRWWLNALAEAHPYAPKGGLVTFTRHSQASMRYVMFQERGRVASLHATERHQAKGVLQTTLRVAHQSFVILNTHLAANYSATWTRDNPYAKVERAQLSEIAQLVHAIPSNVIVVVAGDFNAPRNSWLYNEFRSEAGLVDPLHNSTEPTFRPPPGLPARAIQALDHIMVRPPASGELFLDADLCFRGRMPIAAGTIGYLSDHLGVRLKLRWDDRPDHEKSKPNNRDVVMVS